MFVNMPSSYNEYKEYEKKKSNFKIFKVMKSISKTTFSYYLFKSTFNVKKIPSWYSIFEHPTQQ